MPHQWNYLWKLSWMLNYENVSINLYINLSEVIKQDLLWFDSIWFSRIDTVLYNSILFDYRMKSIDIHKSRLLPPSFLVNNNSIDWGCWIKLSTTYPISRLLHILEVIASYQQHILSHVSSYLGVNNSRLGWGFYKTYLQHILSHVFSPGDQQHGRSSGTGQSLEAMKSVAIFWWQNLIIASLGSQTRNLKSF